MPRKGGGRCRSCRRPVFWRDVDDLPVAFDDAERTAEHYLTCGAPAARRLRVRRGKEPGVFPVSASSFAAWNRCPFGYKRRYIDRVKDPAGDAAEHGRTVHRYLSALLRGEPTPTDLLIPLDFAEEWQRVVREITGLVFAGRLVDPDALAAVDHRRTYEWRDGALTVQLEGELDWMEIFEDRVRITDAKSGWLVARDDERIFADVQTNVYALLAHKEFPLHSDIEFRQLQFRYPNRAPVGHVFSVEEIEAFEVAFRSEVHLMATAVDFPPNPACRFCPPGAHALALSPFEDFELVVKDGRERFSIGPIATAEGAVAVANAALTADALGDAARAALRDYHARTGEPIRAGGGSFDRWPSHERYLDDPEAFIEALKRYRLPLTMVRPNLAALKPYLSGKRRIAEVAEHVHVGRASYDFKWKRDEVDESKIIRLPRPEEEESA